MSLVLEMNARVKNTFLEFVEEDAEVQPRIQKSRTETLRAGNIPLGPLRPDSVPSPDVATSAASTALEPVKVEPLVINPAAPDPAGHPALLPHEEVAHVPEPVVCVARPSIQTCLNTSVDAQRTEINFKTKVKNTFLEIEEEDDDEVQPVLHRARTDFLSYASRHLDEPLSCGCTGGNITPPDDRDSNACESVAVSSSSEPEGIVADASGATQASFPSASRLADGFADEVAEVSLEEVYVLPDTDKVGPTLLGKACAREGKCTTPNVRATWTSGTEPEKTTLMLRNLPNDYTRSMLLELLDVSGFISRYDFVYLPTDFSRRAGLGYAFVNMVTAADAQLVRGVLEGFRQWSVPSSKVCSVGWSSECQGLDANIERYRNSPIMHNSVPDEFKPVILSGGVRIPFPRPTRKPRKPDLAKARR
mmetsp:Transcript_34987/g.81160  ORF Transcript_34987/g.81160 Transcript_34987/m.81160 type:complete len:420 (+) Transcript_34987:76-1335(+)